MYLSTQSVCVCVFASLIYILRLLLSRLFLGDLPPLTQRLLVLICGTLRTITASSETNRMNAEALGVSVAPSFFRSCDGINKTARMEDIVKFKVSKICELIR